jgi:hypothetical protein
MLLQLWWGKQQQMTFLIRLRVFGTLLSMRLMEGSRQKLSRVIDTFHVAVHAATTGAIQDEQ